ncbi:MAG: acetate kinase [Deltaproteobacteria bacterium]|nr:acetate kinase [Deltaproteobacteria bacterium]
MKILVINTGSSSIKYKLFDVDRQRLLASGAAEKIGEETSLLTHGTVLPTGERREIVEEERIPDHEGGLKRIVDLLVDPERGVVGDKSQISAIGHRVVHGGETFRSPTIIDEGVLVAIRENIPLAPLHNPPNLLGIEVARQIFPDSLQVAVFDTAFHQTLPMEAFLYAIPFRLYEEHRIRRYGFHGTSHAYVAERTAAYLKRSPESLNLITIHLGNGASMAAIKEGTCVDTTMGMTPLAGLVMGTRSGDVDPALPFFLAFHLGMTLKEIDDLLNKESGLKGLCGANDMREVIRRRDEGDRPAEMALDLYAYRVKKYIGAYLAAMGSLDALVFTAGVGENSPVVRELCCRGLEKLGIEIDRAQNALPGGVIRDIGIPEREVRILVVPTNEELRIAQETKKVIESKIGT